MKKMTEKEIQKVLLDTLVYVDNFCTEREIPYYMIGGTLLGAVRHGGFIPWDDDIDIAMTRENYEKFLSLWDDKEHDGFMLQNTFTDRKCRHTITRILIKGTRLLHNGSYNVTKEHSELFIDIFPLDNVPDDIELREQQRKDLIKAKRMIGFKFSSRASTKLKHYIKRLRQGFLAPVSYHHLVKKVDIISKRYCLEQTKSICSMSSQYDYNKQAMSRKIYGSPIRIPFEKYAFLAPEHPDEYLKQLYGDYMQLPPKEKQVFNIAALIEE